MVGFKSIALLISLLFLAACVPQTKQTSCSTNEAFNATLRTCVPVMNGPSSYININSFLPTSSLTKYKNDITPITLSVVISNPYAQTYTVEWERVYNGSPVAISPSTPTSYTFAPSLLATEVGTHIISVKIKDTTNNIVDSHSFELKINDNPKPVIQSATVTPATYSSAYTPLITAQPYSFTVFNNGASMVGAGYRTDWKLYRSGLLINSETDSFPTTAPAGTLSTSGFNYPAYSFNPSTLGIGSYVLIARVTNTAAEVVAEQQWTATVAHPPLSKVISRNIYKSTSSAPATVWGTPSIAYNGVAYTGSPTYNFIPSTVSVPVAGAQGDYCVTVASGTGTYPADTSYVKVTFFLQPGGAQVYEGFTTTVDNEVCLSDASAGSLSAVVFSNLTTTTAEPHYIQAKVVDEATGQEYTNSDLNSILVGTYPLTWGFDVRPQNKAPTVDFGTLTGITCSTTSATTLSGCEVTSDTNFTVKVNLIDDDFYYPISASNEANFNYSIRLYENSVNIQTCTKSSIGADTNGADGYDCTFNIKSYNGAGPIDLSTKSYSIKAEITDNGSPITGTGTTSNSLTWDIAMGDVTEYNSSPTIGATWSVLSPVTEGSAINFTFAITDAERDHHTYEIFYCPTALDPISGVCPLPATLIPETTVTRTTNAATINVSASYNLTEGFLLGLTGIGCDAVKRNIACAVNFLVKIKDLPNTAPASPIVVSASAASNITNINPQPNLNTSFSVPAPSAVTALTAFAFVGHPMSITNNPTSILTDTSTEILEKNYRYQWFIKNNTSVTAWTAISGATGPNLVWTPSIIRDSNAPTDNPLSIILCVEDQPASAVTSVNIIDSTCSTASPSPWVVTVRDNFKKVFDLSTLSAPWAGTQLATSAAAGQYGTETAIWYDTPSLNVSNGVTASAAYIAMIGNDQKIHVKKSLLHALAGIDNIDDTHIVTFNALPSGTVAGIKDLSITGTATELYIAYLASQTGSTESFYPQVRRIDLTATTGKGPLNKHPGKMGFDYNGPGITTFCSGSSCNVGPSSIQFSGAGLGISGSFQLNTPNGDFTFYFGTYNGTDTVCGTCMDNMIASNLATIITNSTNPLLAGYSATSSGDTVTIVGAQNSDYFDGSGARIADRMGKIYVSGTNWYLPFINNTLGSTYNDKLSVYTAQTGAVMITLGVSVLEPTTGSAGLGSMDAAIKFDNYFDGTNLWIAMVSKTGSAGRLYKVNPQTYALADSDDIFVGEALLDIQLATSTTNVFVGATTAVGSLKKLGVYDNNGLLQDEFQIDDPFNLEASTTTATYFNTLSISQYKIVPYGTEARLFAVSKGATASSYKLFMARLRKVSSTWTLSCGDCQTVSELGQNISPFVGLGVAAIRDNPTSAYRLSTDGAIPNQGLKDVAYVSMGRLETPTAASCDPAIGVFNVEAESISSSLIFTGGVSPNQDAGLYHSPFIKN